MTIPLGGEPLAIAAVEGLVWTSVANRVASYAPRLVRIDHRTNEVASTIPLDMSAWDLAAAPGAVWAHDYVQNGPDVSTSTQRRTGWLR